MSFYIAKQSKSILEREYNWDLVNDVESRRKGSERARLG